MKVRHQVALVTGGGHRLGRYIAIALAKNGFYVVINYYKSSKAAKETINQIAKLGSKGFSICADVSDKTQVKRMISETISRYGRIDLLVNNAAIFVKSSLKNTSEKIWNDTIDINLKGTFLCSQAVAPLMLKQKSGRIINIASIGGLQAWTQYLPYSVSKAGVIMLTKILAKSLAPFIHVNAIAPGIILMKDQNKSLIKHIQGNKILLRKYGEPSDITDMVVYLAKKEKYITGQVFIIDGGRSIQ